MYGKWVREVMKAVVQAANSTGAMGPAWHMEVVRRKLQLNVALRIALCSRHAKCDLHGVETFWT